MANAMWMISPGEVKPVGSPRPGTPPMTPLTLTIPAPTEFINLNQRLHWAKKAKLTRTWRTVARVHAQRAGLPKGLPRVHVVATIHKPHGRAYDAHNLVPTVKAAIDGLVDYGLLPDDTNAHLIGPDMRQGAKGPARVELTITPLAQGVVTN